MLLQQQNFISDIQQFTNPYPLNNTPIRITSKGSVFQRNSVKAPIFSVKGAISSGKGKTGAMPPPHQTNHNP
jgi:hypothetical protein